jgi:hypothetical protein
MQRPWAHSPAWASCCSRHWRQGEGTAQLNWDGQKQRGHCQGGCSRRDADRVLRGAGAVTRGSKKDLLAFWFQKRPAGCWLVFWGDWGCGAGGPRSGRPFAVHSGGRGFSENREAAVGVQVFHVRQRWGAAIWRAQTQVLLGRLKCALPGWEEAESRRAADTAAEASCRSHASGSGARGLDAGSWGAGYGVGRAGRYAGG